MNKVNFVLVLVLSFVFVTTSQAMGELGTQKVETTQEVVVDQEAIEGLSVVEELGILNEFKVLSGTAEKVSFLLAKANEFYNSEQFQKAIDAAQYVLQYLDADSQEAKDLLAKAKDALVAAASDKLEEAKTGIGEKLGIFGN